MNSLFREEVVSRRRDRLSGEIAIFVPVGWGYAVYTLFAALVVSAIFLSLAKYTRVETVSGLIVPDKGIAMIFPSRPGVLDVLNVRDGDFVSQGAALATIRVDEDLSGGASTATLKSSALRQQDTSLVAQIDADKTSAAAQLAQLHAQKEGLNEEIGQLNAQINYQVELIETAKKDLDRAQEFESEGYITARDIEARQDSYTKSKQILAQLQQSVIEKKAALNEAVRNEAQIVAQGRAQVASLMAARAQVAQQSVTAVADQAYVLRAPVAGRVTAVTSRVGQNVSTQTSLLNINPPDGRLRVELRAPSSAIGFIRPRELVRVAIDAFPYERFGTLEGVVATVADSGVVERLNDQTSIVYPVTVKLNSTHIMVYGRPQNLIPGMTLNARIIAERQSLLEWLFDPLFAVRKR